MIPPFLVRPLIYASVAGVALLGVYFKGRSDGAEPYYALTANLERSAIVVKKATEKANSTRKEEKAREAEVFAGLDLRLSNELPKVSPVAGCAIPDDARLRFTDDIARTANAALRVYSVGVETPAEKPAP